MSENPISKLAEEAEKIVHGERHDSYGHPSQDYKYLSQTWSAWINRRHNVNITLTPLDCIMMMVLLKVNREAEKHKHDNLVDIAGYAICADELGLDNGKTE